MTVGNDPALPLISSKYFINVPGKNSSLYPSGVGPPTHIQVSIPCPVTEGPWLYSLALKFPSPPISKSFHYPSCQQRGPRKPAPPVNFQGFLLSRFSPNLKYKPICFFPLSFLPLSILRTLCKSKNKLGKVTYRSDERQKKKITLSLHSETPSYSYWMRTKINIFLIIKKKNLHSKSRTFFLIALRGTMHPATCTIPSVFLFCVSLFLSHVALTEKFISLIMKEPGKLTLPKGSHISLPSFQFFPLPCH